MYNGFEGWSYPTTPERSDSWFNEPDSRGPSILEDGANDIPDSDEYDDDDNENMED